jgi:hypothetical protein
MHWLIHHYQKLTSSPGHSALSFLTFITTAWGLIAIYESVSKWTSSTVASWVVASVIGICILPIVVLPLFPSFRKRLQLPEGQRHLCPHVERQWHIEQNGHAVVETRKHLLFFLPPLETDLSDTGFGSVGYTKEDFHYESEDADPTDYSCLNSNLHRFFWKPKKGDIKIGLPYQHHCKLRFPVSQAVEHKSMTVVSPVYVGKYELTIQSALPIKKIIAFRGKTFHKLKDTDSIIHEAKRVKRTYAPPAELSLDKYTAKWSLGPIQPGEIYYLVMFFSPNEGIVGVIA